LRHLDRDEPSKVSHFAAIIRSVTVPGADGQTRYALEVSRGYVRLVRSGPRRRRSSPSFRFEDPDLARPAGEDELDWAVALELEQLAAEEAEMALWADDSDLEMAEYIPDEVLHPAKGDRGCRPAAVCTCAGCSFPCRGSWSGLARR
jgi:hypothetical protein